MKLSRVLAACGVVMGAVAVGAVAAAVNQSLGMRTGVSAQSGVVAGEFKTPLATPDAAATGAGTSQTVTNFYSSAAAPTPAATALPVSGVTTPAPTPAAAATPLPAATPKPTPSLTPYPTVTPKPLPTVAPCGGCNAPALNKAGQSIACPLIYCPQDN